MKNLKLLWVLLCVFSSSVFAQSQVSDAYARISQHSSSTVYDCVFTIEVSDTSNTSAIEIKLGTAVGLSDLISYTFNYDVNSGLPSGYSYSRIGNNCTLDAGTISASDMYFGEIRIQQPNGSWSPAYKFVSN